MFQNPFKSDLNLLNLSSALQLILQSFLARWSDSLACRFCPIRIRGIKMKATKRTQGTGFILTFPERRS